MWQEVEGSGLNPPNPPPPPARAGHGEAGASHRARRQALPAGVWILGLGSLLMDLSSEMIHSLLPLFLVGALGVSVFALGLIEGVAEAVALVARVFSGVLSDRLRQRKRLLVLGYALATLAKPLFALAAGAAAVVATRCIDRLGKGIRGSPRDALLADIAPPGRRGAAFGLRQALDSVGAVLGPLLAVALMLIWANDFRAVFWVAVVPAMLAVVLLMLGVKDPLQSNSGPVPPPLNPLQRESLVLLGPAYWQVVAFGAVFTLARFSEAFLVLRAQQLGWAVAWVPLVMVVMSVAYAACAYPCGKLADRIDRRWLLAAGMLALVAADIVLAAAAAASLVIVGVLLWGVHLGMTQGLLSAMVADSAPESLRGTAFGFFNLSCGLATLAASAIAGLLWQVWGAAATFASGAAFALLTLLGLALIGSGKAR